jgi:hypothetical protein
VTSYRIALGVGLLLPGIEPDAVLPAAAGAARELTTVEAFDVAVVRGEARITVRFVADGDREAWAIARVVRAAVGALAGVTSPELTRRYGPRWHPVYLTR